MHKNHKQDQLLHFRVIHKMFLHKNPSEMIMPRVTPSTINGNLINWNLLFLNRLCEASSNIFINEQTKKKKN